MRLTYIIRLVARREEEGQGPQSTKFQSYNQNHVFGNSLHEYNHILSTFSKIGLTPGQQKHILYWDLAPPPPVGLATGLIIYMGAMYYNVLQ